MSGNLELRGDGRLPEEAALADQLCALFDSLGVSYRRYAAGRPYDHSTVYRYLKGERPPTWGFIHDLLYAVAEAQGSTPTAEAIGLFRKLHNDVLKAGNSPQHKVLLLEHQLADAHKKARQAAVREQWLEQAVEEHQGRIRNLEIGQRELEATAAATAEEAEDERVQLYAEIDELKAKLARTRQLHQQAEERCEQLERQLAETEAQAQQQASAALPMAREEADDVRAEGDEEGARIVQDVKKEAAQQRAKPQEELQGLQRRNHARDEELSRNPARPRTPLPPRLYVSGQPGPVYTSVGDGTEEWAGVVVAGRYRLERELGRGGMGRVWEALDTPTDRKVALKGLRDIPDSDEREQWVHRARREAQALSRIMHQNVVRFHDVVEEGGQVWIVMELFDPRTLGDVLCEQGPLAVPHTAEIGLQVLRGLKAVHEAGVLHRDVKPDNILFRPDGRALLMDFGIATYKGAPRVTQIGQIIGALEYLAPELVSAAPEDRRPASAASDLWALGVTLYEMVEGRRPFEGVNDYEILVALRESPVPPMQFAGRLTRLIEALLDKDPALRPDAAEAQRMLELAQYRGTPPRGISLDLLDRSGSSEFPHLLDRRESGNSSGPGGWLARFRRRLT
ncbi:protein kinase domain-containing protein [Streptomyces bobili]